MEIKEGCAFNSARENRISMKIESQQRAKMLAPEATELIPAKVSGPGVIM